MFGALAARGQPVVQLLGAAAAVLLARAAVRALRASSASIACAREL